MASLMINHRWARRDPYPSRSEREEQTDMSYYLEKILGDIDFSDADTFEQFPILRALHEDGVYTFYDLMGLTLEDIVTI